MKMKIKKGTLLKIQHTRKGTFLGYAEKDFDLDEEFYPIISAVERVNGLNTFWEAGEKIPCRGEFCKITIFKTEARETPEKL